MLQTPIELPTEGPPTKGHTVPSTSYTSLKPTSFSFLPPSLPPSLPSPPPPPQVWDPATGDCTATLKHGDDVMVLCCDFSPDASRLITGDTSGSVKVPMCIVTVEIISYYLKSQFSCSLLQQTLFKQKYCTSAEKLSML